MLTFSVAHSAWHGLFTCAKAPNPPQQTTYKNRARLSDMYKLCASPRCVNSPHLTREYSATSVEAQAVFDSNYLLG